MNDDELRKLDYEKTVEMIKQLTEIRFKLLTLLPIATGAAISLAVSKNDSLTGLLLGLLGFFFTIGVIFYDQRNTEIYEIQVRRAKLLEINLKIPAIIDSDKYGGTFNGRVKRDRKLFGLISMWHDRGLAFIYSSVLASWTFMISASAISFIFQDSLEARITLFCISSLVSTWVALISWIHLHQLDNHKSERHIQLDREITEKFESK